MPRTATTRADLQPRKSAAAHLAESTPLPLRLMQSGSAGSARHPTPARLRLLRQHRVRIRVRRRAGAHDPQHVGAGVPDLVARSGRDDRAVADADLALLVADAQAAGPGGDE